MTKLSIDLIRAKLLETYELKKVAQVIGPRGELAAPSDAGAPSKPSWKRHSSKSGKPHQVAKPGEPSLKLTKVTQVEMPRKSSRTTDAGKRSGNGIPQAERADKIVAKHKVPRMSTATNQKSPKLPRVARGKKPNQTTKLEKIGDAVKRTDDDNPHKSALPQADYAGSYTAKMPHGSKNMNTGNDDVPTVKAPKAKNLGATTSPKGGERRARFDVAGRDTHHATQVSGPSGFVGDPKDAGRRSTKYEKKTGGSQNVVESGVVVKLGGKTMAKFDVVSGNVLNKLVESYRGHGYNVRVERGKAAAWQSDRVFLKTIYESVDAKWNNVPKHAEAARKAALQRFYKLSQSRFNRLYEGRAEFVSMVRSAFERIEKLAEAKYLKGLEIFECTARIKTKGQVADVSVITEATDHGMALRQIRAKIAEDYGFDTPMRHVFIDGTKYQPRQITEWSPKE